MAISKIESAALASGVPSRSQLPAGTVLQVVHGSTSTQYVTNSANTQVAISNLNTTITPTSATSKILVLYSFAVVLVGNNCGYKFKVQRNGSDIWNPGSTYEVYQSSSAGAPGDNYSRQSLVFYDAPATTSPVTYAPFFNTYSSTNNIVGVNYAGHYTSTVTLMEIAA